MQLDCGIIEIQKGHYNKRGNCMIKLIATDVDGTLCRISTPKIHEGYYANSTDTFWIRE